MSYQIVTDSSANLPEEIIEKFALEVLSLTFKVGDNEYKSYEKGKKTDLRQFYTMMRNKENIVTSLASPDDFTEFFSRFLSEGKDVLYLGFSSGLSGTYQSACIAIEDLKEKYPERKILAVDTKCAALGQGLLVYLALEKKQEGASIDEVHDFVQKNILNMCHWFTVDDLFFLHRGGRVSRSTAIMGTALGIKPVMHVDDDGKLVAVGKARGRKASLLALVKKFMETAIDPESQVIAISHGDCEEDIEFMVKHIKEKVNVKEIIINNLDPVIGAHAGPGTAALFFLGSTR